MTEHYKFNSSLHALLVRPCHLYGRTVLVSWLSLLLLGMGALSAGDALAASTPVPEVKVTLPRNEPVILDVTLNQVKRGAFPIILTVEGDYLLRGDDLQVIGVLPPYGSHKLVGGEKYFSLSRLGATLINLNENWLTLSAELPAERWPKQSADFISPQPLQLYYPNDNSAYFNYRMQNTGNDSGMDDTWVLGGEVGIRYSELSFRTESAYLRQGGQPQHFRYGTSITHDNRDTLQRLIVGDFAASSGTLGSTLNLGGLSFSKAFAINPYYVKQPTAGFVSTITAPSAVEIYLDGARLREGTLQPGEFELKNLNYYGGRHDIEMVIRDAFGREQRIAYPYYFSDQNLREGLHDYSYNIGRLRSGIGTPEDEYGRWAFSAYHRYGVNDYVTLGARGEAELSVNSIGPAAVVRTDRWGVVSGSLSRSTSDTDTGAAGSVTYGYQVQRFNLQGGMRRYTSGYEQVGIPATTDRPRQEVTAAIGYAMKQIGNIGLSLRNLGYYSGTDQKTASLSYSRNLYHAFNLMAAVGRTTTTESSNYFYITLNYYPGRSFNSSFTHQQNGGNYSDSLQVGNATPMGEGLGYRVTADRLVTDGIETTRVSPWAQYNTRHAIYTGNVQGMKQADGSIQTGYQWGISGGIAYVSDRISFSRPISDSFALVEVGNLEGVRVYSSSQEIGRTDKSGQMLLPNLGSYLVNRISVDDSDIPIDYTLSSRELNISPPLRSGSLLHFDVKQLLAVTGRLYIKMGNEWTPAEFSELNLEIDWRRHVFPTGRDGEFYLENVPAGSYKVQVEYQSNHCEFVLDVPKSREALTELGEVHGCEMVR